VIELYVSSFPGFDMVVRAHTRGLLGST
jgi:hypothetical protein